MIGSPAHNGERLGNPVQVRDGPAAVRGDAPLPRRHWPAGWEDGEGGCPESEDLSLAATRTPRGREDSCESAFSSQLSSLSFWPESSRLLPVPSRFPCALSLIHISEP